MIIGMRNYLPKIIVKWEINAQFCLGLYIYSYPFFIVYFGHGVLQGFA